MDHKQLKGKKQREPMTGASLLRYLPDIYHRSAGDGDHFLERFLEPFAEMLDQLDETIFTIHRYFEPLHSDPLQAAPLDFVPWLAQWLSLDLYEILDKDNANLENNRRFILEAARLYKKKGTAPGIAELLTVLTGKPCCVKEYANNVFRSYGMEHGGENEIGPPGDSKCRAFHRTVSRTVDTTDRGLSADMGAYEDTLHYTADTGENGRYNRNVIGLFLFIYSPGESFTVDKKIHEIIKAFLPVFVRAEITVVEKVDYYETYPLGAVREEHDIIVREDRKEKIKKHTGVYRDNVNWEWFHTNDKERGLTFLDGEEPDPLIFRTPHGGIGVEFLS